MIVVEKSKSIKTKFDVKILLFLKSLKNLAEVTKNSVSVPLVFRLPTSMPLIGAVSVPRSDWT